MGFYMFIAQRNLDFLLLVIPTTEVHDGIFDYEILCAYIIFCIEKYYIRHYYTSDIIKVALSLQHL